jgi:hypothetical protein
LKRLRGIIGITVLAFCSTTAFAGQGASRMLYTVPNTTFIEQPSGETVVTLNDTSGSIATVQASLTSARAANPTNVLVLRLLGRATYWVTNAGLVLGSHECLVLGTATIKAVNSSVTMPLIQIASGSTNVSVAGGVLDGSSAGINGIYAPAAGRVNVDKVTVLNCGLDCILLKGNGNSTYDNEMTVTRCEALGSAAHAGISIQNATQAACLDNYCHNNSVGIWIACAYSTFANNTCNSNSLGIDFNSGNDNVIANNTCNYNGTGILADGSATMIVSDSFAGNSVVGINSSGSGNIYIDNLFGAGNAANFLSGGAVDKVVAYKGPLNASGQDYFYPPLIDDQHSTTIVNGMGRTDLSISSTTIDSVQSQYNSARVANPNNVVVLHLNGTFAVGATPLTLQSNTCVLLNGTIQINSSTAASAAITGGTVPTHVSISGGVIDGSNLTGNNGVYFPGGSMLQLDGVRLQNFGPDNPRVGGSDVVRFTSGGATPQIVTRCYITNGAARGIWLENSGTKRLVSDCEVTAVNQDGVDCDASTSGSVVKFNYCHDLVRYGVFFEQSASHNLALGNICNNDGRDINLYNNSSTPRGATQYNSVLCNWCLGNNGLRNGSTSTNTVQTSHNFLFGNIVINASISSEIYGAENYYSQTYLAGGSLSTAGTESFFNSAEVSSNLFVQDSNSGLAVLVSGAATTNGAPVVIGAPSGLGNDQWALVPTDSGFYQIKNLKSGLDLNVSGASTNAGAVVIQWPFGSSKNDQWTPMSAGNGLYYFLNRHCGLCLDVPGNAAGTQLDQQPYSGAANQQFNLTLNTPISGPPAPFTMSVYPGSQAVIAGGSNTFTVTLVTNANFTGGVSFSLSGLPVNSTAAFNPASLSGSGTSTLTVTTTTNTPVGVYPLTISGVGSGATNTAAISLTVNSGIVASPGTLLWVGTNNWSVAQNWTNLTTPGYGPPGISNDVVFTNLATVATSNSINNTMNSDTTINSLTFNNTNGFHTTQIAPGATLAIIGSKGVTVGTESDLGSTAAVFDSITGAGGTLVVSNSAASLIVRQGAVTGGSQRATLDLSGLGTFNATLNQVSIGVAGPVVRETGTLMLAKTNSITASGSIAVLVGDNSSNAGGQNYLYLGQVNSIFADSITIGRQKITATLAFNPAFLNASAFFRGADGLRRVANWNIGDNSAQSSSSSSTHGTVDLSGSTVDALVDALVIGKSQKTTGADTFGTLTFASGTLDVNTLQVGFQAQSGATSAGNGTLNVNGPGALLNANTILELGHTSGGAGTTNTSGTLNLNAGTVQTTNVAGGGGVSTINLNGGTLNIEGGKIANVFTLNVGTTGATNAALLFNAATISTSNTITIAANGTLAGNTVITSPGLMVSGTLSPGASGIGAITNNGPATFGPGGTLAVAVQNATGAPVSGWDFLQIGGSLNVQATSANPFLLQLQSFDANGPGEVTNFSADSSYSWNIALAGGGFSGFAPASFTVDTSKFQNDLAGGYFGAATNGNFLAVTFTNNHPPVAQTFWQYQRPSGLAISIATLSANWSDPDADLVALNDVDTTSTNGIPVNSDTHSIYYSGATAVPDAISYTVQDVRTNPPAIYRPGDTQRTASGIIVLLPPPAITIAHSLGGNLMLSGTGGIPGGYYSVLTTTNVILPLNQWQSFTTNNFDSNGNFSFTSAPGSNASQGFYLLRLED